jgi:hypothetical protein
MSTATLQIAPLRPTDPTVEANAKTILYSPEQFKKLREKLAIEFDASILSLADRLITNADVTNFNFEGFANDWMQILERFHRQKEALETFRRDLNSASERYKKDHNDELIAAFTQKEAAELQLLHEETQKGTVITARVERFQKILAELQSYGSSKTAKSGQTKTTQQQQQQTSSQSAATRTAQQAGGAGRKQSAQTGGSATQTAQTKAAPKAAKGGTKKKKQSRKRAPKK